MSATATNGRATAAPTGPAAAVRDLTITLPGPSGPASVVDAVSFEVPRGATTGVIGESGSGKTLSAMALAGLLPVGSTASGQVTVGEHDVLSLRGSGLRRLRRTDVSIVFQDPASALNPTMPVGAQIGEVLRGSGLTAGQRRDRVLELMSNVGIVQPEQRIRQYPHQFSGGQRQRIMIAVALARRPMLLIADEPTTGLDVTVQSRILDLLDRLRRDEALTLLLISHDLRVMSHVADHLVVMYAGRVVEAGPARQLLEHPGHPYTRALVTSVPSVHDRSAIANPLPGTAASPFARPDGCAFHPRCPLATDRCRTEQPPLRLLTAAHSSACHHAEQVR